MHLVVSLAIAALSVIVLKGSISRLFEQVRVPGRGAIGLATIALIWGGFFSDTSAAAGRPGAKLAMIFVFGALVLVAPRTQPSGPGRPTLNPMVAIVFLWLWLFLTNAVRNPDLPGILLAGRFASGLPWIVLLLSWRRTPINPELLSAVASSGLALVGITAPFLRESGWRACDQYKCGVFGGSFVGPFTSENYIGQQAILVGALALVSLGWKRSRQVQILVVLLLAATESRTAQVALVAALAALLLVGLHRFITRRSSSGPLASTVVALLTPSLFVTAALALFFRAEPGSYSNRGNIWIRARSVLQDDLVTGLGIDRWDQLQAVGALPVHYPHSVYVLIMFAGGAIGLVAFVAWVLTCIRATARGSKGPFAALVFSVVFLTVGLLEVTWNPLTVDGLTWHALALISLTSPARMGHERALLGRIRRRQPISRELV